MSGIDWTSPNESNALSRFFLITVRVCISQPSQNNFPQIKPLTELYTTAPLAGVCEGSSAATPRPQSDLTPSLKHVAPPTTSSPLRGISKRAQQGQSAGCSGQDLFTSNHESMQLRREVARGYTLPLTRPLLWGLAPRLRFLSRGVPKSLL